MEELPRFLLVTKSKNRNYPRQEPEFFTNTSLYSSMDQARTDADHAVLHHLRQGIEATVTIHEMKEIYAWNVEALPRTKLTALKKRL